MQSDEASRRASERGYEATGIYDFYKDTVQKRQKQIKDMGYKCIMFKIHSHPLSRGGRDGWKLFVEKGKHDEIMDKLFPKIREENAKLRDQK